VQISNESAISRALAPLEARLEMIAQRLNGPVNDDSPAATNNTDYRTFFWGGKCHFLPENFLFPRCTVSALWRFWIWGDENKNLIPFNQIDPQSLDKKHRPALSKARKVMDKLIASSQHSLEELAIMPKAEVDAALTTSYSSILADLRIRTKIHNIQFSVAYHHIRSID
jgi:hypothetical protein